MKDTVLRYDYDHAPPLVEKSLVFDDSTRDAMMTEAFLSEISITAEASALPFTPDVVSADTRVRNGVCTAYVRTVLCEDGTLYERLLAYARTLNKATPVPFYEPRMIALYFYELVTVLYLLHRMGIAHHDIKMENVLMRDAYYVILADYGFACHYTPGTLGYHVCGTPAYAAPEKRNNFPHCFEKSDVWSLGCMFYIMYTGSIIQFSPDYTKISGNDDIAPIIKSMLAHNPAARLSFSQLRQTHLYETGQNEFLANHGYIIDVESYHDRRRTWFVPEVCVARDTPSPRAEDDAESGNFVLTDTPRRRSPREFLKEVVGKLSSGRNLRDEISPSAENLEMNENAENVESNDASEPRKQSRWKRFIQRLSPRQNKNEG